MLSQESVVLNKIAFVNTKHLSEAIYLFNSMQLVFHKNLSYSLFLLSEKVCMSYSDTPTQVHFQRAEWVLSAEFTQSGLDQ